MNIVVTKNKVDYTGSSFLKLSSLEEACQIVGTIDVLVYNNSSESSDTKLECLGILKDRVKKLIYICSEDRMDMAVKILVSGSEGKCLDDEFFLESGFELEHLIETLDEVTALAELSGVSILGDFFDRYLRNGSSSFNSNYLMVVKEAVNSLIEDYNQKNFEIIQMCETATDMFSNISSLLVSMKKERESMQEIVERVTSKVKEPQGVKRVTGSSVYFYPRVNYPKAKSIVRIKKIGNFKFFVSFVLAFGRYLESVKNLRVKLIFLTPQGDLYEEMYGDFNWVTSSNVKSLSYYYNRVVFTNCPSKDVIDNLLNDSDYDIFVVADMLLFDSEHILNSKSTSSVKYAVSSISSIKKFKLNKKDCISSMVDMEGLLGVVPMFSEYPNDVSARERFYMSELASVYEKLVLGVIRG